MVVRAQEVLILLTRVNPSARAQAHGSHSVCVPEQIPNLLCAFLLVWFRFLILFYLLLTRGTAVTTPRQGCLSPGCLVGVTCLLVALQKLWFPRWPDQQPGRHRGAGEGCGPPESETLAGLGLSIPCLNTAPGQS